MPKIDLDAISKTNRSTYPEPFGSEMAKRHYRRLAPVAGITDFGVSHVELEPGGISSQRHWHETEDEFVVLLEGEALLVEDRGETLLRPGDCVAFPKNVANAHHLVNRSNLPCRFLAFGQQANGTVHYPDIDLHWDGQSQTYRHKDGSPY